jgi:hypothetical protein
MRGYLENTFSNSLNERKLGAKLSLSLPCKSRIEIGLESILASAYKMVTASVYIWCIGDAPLSLGMHSTISKNTSACLRL